MIILKDKLYFYRITNRLFMKKNFVFLLLGLISCFLVSGQPQPPGPQPAPETGEKFKLGMAGWTFVKFDLDKTLETLRKMDVHYLCIKDFHLPLNSTDEQIAAFKNKLKENGVTGYGVGPIYMKS